MSKPKVRLSIYEPHDMARVTVNGEEIFLGNFWDFHPGCYGTKFRCLGKTVTITNFDGPKSFAALLANKIDGDLTVYYRKRPIPC